MHAAILNFKLKDYSKVVDRRRSIAQTYHNALCEIPDLNLPPAPDADSDRFDVFQNYEICTDNRDELRKFLADRGVGTIVQWGGFGIHQLERLMKPSHLPKTDRFFRRSLLLPMNHMLSDEEALYTVGQVQDFFKKGL